MESFRYLIGLVASAFVMGGLFDLYNTILGSTKWLRWMRPALDILFWISSACLVYYVVFVTDSGQLRIYTFVILLLGYGLYRLLFHRIVVGSALGFVRMIRGLVLFTLRVINFLVFRPLMMILWIIFRVGHWLYRLGVNIEDGAAWVVRALARMIWYPFHWLWPREFRFMDQIVSRWEDFWTWLSKRITNPIR